MTSSDEAADGLKMSSSDTGRVHHTIPPCVALLSFRLCLLSESQSKQSSTPWRRSSSSPAARFLSFVPLQFFFWEEKTVVLFSYYKSFLPLFAHTHTHKHYHRWLRQDWVDLHRSQQRSRSPHPSPWWTICLQNMKYCSSLYFFVESCVCVFHSAHELLQKC